MGRSSRPWKERRRKRSPSPGVGLSRARPNRNQNGTRGWAAIDFRGHTARRGAETPGELILDATVAEQAIRYPNDLSLFNEAWEFNV